LRLITGRSGNDMVPAPVSDRSDVTRADTAFAAYQGIIATKLSIQADFLDLGRLFKDVRDNNFHKELGYDSFEEFLGAPEISMRRSSVYQYIALYEAYSTYPKAVLAEIGVRKLQTIKPVVERDPAEWLLKAKELSVSDLTNEVRTAQGKPERLPESAHAERVRKDEPEPARAQAKTYREFILSSRCVTCNASGVEPHHFPLTRGAGGDEVADWFLPLCRKCHDDAQRDPRGWSWVHKSKIWRWVYSTIKKLHEASA
jgi:hypothetical protein